MLTCIDCIQATESQLGAGALQDNRPSVSAARKFSLSRAHLCKLAVEALRGGLDGNDTGAISSASSSANSGGSGKEGGGGGGNGGGRGGMSKSAASSPQR